MPEVGPVVHIVDSRTITSQGDALRELESLGVELTDPFVLMSGDTVANVNLRRIVDEHKARRERDSKVVMTSLAMVVPHDGIARAHTDCLCVAYDSTTMQLLAYVRAADRGGGERDEDRSHRAVLRVGCAGDDSWSTVVDCTCRETAAALSGTSRLSSVLCGSAEEIAYLLLVCCVARMTTTRPMVCRCPRRLWMTMSRCPFALT